MGLTDEQRARIAKRIVEHKAEATKEEEEYQQFCNDLRLFFAKYPRHFRWRYFDDIEKIRNEIKQKEEDDYCDIEEGDYVMEVTENKKEFERLPLYSEDLLKKCKIEDIALRLDIDCQKYPFDEVEQYYFTFEASEFYPCIDKMLVVSEKRLARLLYVTENTIRNYYEDKGVISPITTGEAKNGQHRYYNLLKSIEAIELYKAEYRQRRNETRKAGKQPKKDKATGKFISKANN